MMRKGFKLKIFISLLALFISVLLFSYQTIGNIVGNSWFLLTEPIGYFIPQESNICDFQPLIMNNGSGDWWIYAKDRINIYHLHPDNSLYYYINKYHLANYDGVDTVFDSWPKENVMTNTIKWE